MTPGRIVLWTFLAFAGLVLLSLCGLGAFFGGVAAVLP